MGQCDGWEEWLRDAQARGRVVRKACCVCGEVHCCGEIPGRCFKIVSLWLHIPSLSAVHGFPRQMQRVGESQWPTNHLCGAVERFEMGEMLQVCSECMGELEVCWWGTGRRGPCCASCWAKPGRVALLWSVCSLPREASQFLLYSRPRRLRIWTFLFHVAEWHANQSDWFQRGFKKTKVVKHPDVFNWWNWAFLLCAWVTDLSSGFVALHLVL